MGASKCVDPKFDAKLLDLTRVELVELTGRQLQVTWWLTTPLPSTNDQLLYVVASSSDGKSSYQLGVKFQRGVQIAYFTFDQYGNGGQTNLEGAAVVDGVKVLGTFPIPTDLRTEFDWYGGTTWTGADVDVCPGRLGTFKTQLFPDSTR